MSTERLYTREEILEALAIRPCHITGLHEPDHHLKYSCAEQDRESVRALMVLLDASFDERPHRLHEGCGWCHNVPSQEEYRARLRETHEWAGVPVPEALAAPAPDAECFDVSEAEVMRAVKKLAKATTDGRVSWGAIEEDGLGLPRFSNHYQRPLHRLVDQGKLVHEHIRNQGYVRVAT